jgi:hypothetical protein
MKRQHESLILDREIFFLQQQLNMLNNEAVQLHAAQLYNQKNNDKVTKALKKALGDQAQLHHNGGELHLDRSSSSEDRLPSPVAGQKEEEEEVQSRNDTGERTALAVLSALSSSAADAHGVGTNVKSAFELTLSAAVDMRPVPRHENSPPRAACRVPLQGEASMHTELGGIGGVGIAQPGLQYVGGHPIKAVVTPLPLHPSVVPAILPQAVRTPLHPSVGPAILPRAVRAPDSDCVGARKCTSCRVLQAPGSFDEGKATCSGCLLKKKRKRQQRRAEKRIQHNNPPGIKYIAWVSERPDRPPTQSMFKV